MSPMLFEVSYTVKCKPGFFSNNEFHFSYPVICQSWDEVYDDISDFLHSVSWKKLQFIEATEPDVRMVNDRLDARTIMDNQDEFDRRFLPVLKQMLDKNGTLPRNNNNRSGGNGGTGSNGGGGIPLWAKAAGSFYAGYKIGKSNLTG